LQSEGKPLELVEADLLASEEIWRPIVRGCKYVFHTASPFYNDAKTEEELVKPAVEGTLSVLRSCAEEDSVERVVLTSSIAAVRYVKGLSERKEPITEADWTSVEDLGNNNPYVKSKTLAERAAWEFVEKNSKNKFSMAAINPVLIVGPPTFKTTSTSINSVLKLADGSLKTARDSYIGFVDVRDVAEAHLRAAETSEAAGKRFILTTGNYHYNDVAEVLKKVLAPRGYKTAATCEKRASPPLPNSTEQTESVLQLKPLSFQQSISDMADAFVEMKYLVKEDVAVGV